MSALYLTPKQLAERWACDPSYVRRLCRSGALRALRLGSDWRISPDVAEAYERGHTSETAETEAEASAPTVQPAAARLVPAIELDGPYDAVFAGPVPWRRDVIAAPAAGRTRSAGKEKRLSAATKNR